MQYVTKQDYINALNKIIEPVRSALIEGGSLPSYGSSAAWYDDISAGVESFARPLWGLVPLWRGGYGDEQMKELYRKGIISGTDPKSDGYWGGCGSRDQRYVEMASMAYAMLLTPEVVWTPLNDEQKQNFKSWLWQINTHEVCDSNWRFFRVLVNIALKSVGEEYAQDRLDEDLSRLDEFYLGGGWYMDGPQQQKDYYISMAFHFYGLIYSCFENDEYAAKFRHRAELFAQDFVYWFADCGAALPYGRSLTYRFAQGAFWGACLLADVKPFDAEVIKGLISRHLDYWLKAPIFDNGGVLTIGYRYPNLRMAEHYNAPGSPYWGLKFFVFVALLDDDEFWSVPAAPLPELDKSRLMREADMLIQRDCGEVYAYTAGTHSSLGCGHIPEKYLKFVYSTPFGFNVSYENQELWTASPDNMLVFYIGGMIHMRRDNHSFELTESGLVINWSPFGGIRVRTEIMPKGASHIRKHTIYSDYDCIAYDCAYALAAGDKDGCECGNGYAQNSKYRCEISSDSGEGMSFAAAVNTNLLNPKTVIPAVKFRINKGVTEINSEISVQKL